MGKGLALQVKQLYPKTFNDYSVVCKEGRLKIGQVHYFRENEKIIINFPTKDKWRAKSKLSYITDGLPVMIDLLKKLNIKSIAIPPLGCGLGGLKWDEVKQVLLEHLETVSDALDIFIYQPI
jgi:O-acetyl-ADP-ribose deacetylase (regulator of RNase III)